MSIRKRYWKPNPKGRNLDAKGQRFDRMCWMLDYKDPKTGKRKAMSFKTQAEAKEAETKMKVEVANGTHVPRSESKTVREAGERWLHVKGNPNGRHKTVEASTLRNYELHFRYIEPALGNVKLVDLDYQTVDSFVEAKLLGEYGLSKAMARKVLVSLKSIIRLAVKEKAVGFNGAEDVTIEQDERAEKKKKVEIPSKEEISALMVALNNFCADPRPAAAAAWKARRALIMTAIDTGMRASELRGLKWEYVNFEKGVIEVRERADEKNKLGSLKSEKAERDIFISETLMVVLKTHKLAQGQNRTLVFGTDKDKPQALANIFARCWKPLQFKAGLCDMVGGEPVHRYKFHALRHYHASMLIDDPDATPKEIQEEMGHADIQMTYNVYGHLMRSEEHEEKRRRRVERNSVAALDAT